MYYQIVHPVAVNLEEPAPHALPQVQGVIYEEHQEIQHQEIREVYQVPHAYGRQPQMGAQAFLQYHLDEVYHAPMPNMGNMGNMPNMGNVPNMGNIANVAHMNDVRVHVFGVEQAHRAEAHMNQLALHNQQLAAFQQDLVRTQTELNESRDAIRALQEKIRNLKSQNRELTANLKIQTEMSRHLTSNLLNVQNEFRGAETTIAALHADRMRMWNEMEDLRKMLEERRNIRI